jgi:hypothetical protein
MLSSSTGYDTTRVTDDLVLSSRSLYLYFSRQLNIGVLFCNRCFVSTPVLTLTYYLAYASLPCHPSTPSTSSVPRLLHTHPSLPSQERARRNSWLDGASILRNGTCIGIAGHTLSKSLCTYCSWCYGQPFHPYCCISL